MVYIGRSINSGPLDQTNFKEWHRCNLGGGGEPTFEGEADRRGPVAPSFKNKTRYTPYVSPGSQISHIAINKGNINRQCLNT